jgi:ppGpp synthetase/RelA/SpoT-type nucleotidyltranferase
MLEPDAGKLARPVLRGGGAGNSTSIPDRNGRLKVAKARSSWNFAMSDPVLAPPAQPTSEEQPFDFDQHREEAVEAYRNVRDLYDRFAEVVRQILEASLDSKHVLYHEIEARAKDIDSFGKKAAKRSETSANQPRYTNPLTQITDLAGVRVIVFFPKTLAAVDECISQDFVVEERSDKSEELEEEGRFGYKSIHYLVRMKPERLALPEYRRFTNLVAEIQSRTILQHAWAEMEHDIQYKSVDVIPVSISRRFIALAGMLEIADREFQAIQDEDEQISTQAQASVEQGHLAGVEITPNALKLYLDRRLGPDGRMKLWGYYQLARVLRKMGFRDFQQIDECVRGFDDDQISRMHWDTRQGQISRFEDLLLAGMGENYNRLHPWSNTDWWIRRNEEFLRKLRERGIQTREYVPQSVGSN